MADTIKGVNHTRRQLLRAAALGGGLIAGELWVPGAKLISIPKPRESWRFVSRYNNIEINCSSSHSVFRYAIRNVDTGIILESGQITYGPQGIVSRHTKSQGQTIELGPWQSDRLSIEARES